MAPSEGDLDEIDRRRWGKSNVDIALGVEDGRVLKTGPSMLWCSLDALKLQEGLVQSISVQDSAQQVHGCEDPTDDLDCPSAYSSMSECFEPLSPKAPRQQLSGLTIRRSFVNLVVDTRREKTEGVTRAPEFDRTYSFRFAKHGHLGNVLSE